MLQFLGPILGVGKAILSGKGAAGVAGAALESAGDFFNASARERRMELEIELQQARDSGEVAKIQAQDKSFFIRAGRPAMIWVAVAAGLYHFLIFPIIFGLAEKYGYTLVDLDWQELSAFILMGLGMAGMRSYEKMKGVARESMR